MVFPFPLTSDIAIITEIIAIQSMVSDVCCDTILLLRRYKDMYSTNIGTGSNGLFVRYVMASFAYSGFSIIIPGSVVHNKVMDIPISVKTKISYL